MTFGRVFITFWTGSTVLGGSKKQQSPPPPLLRKLLSKATMGLLSPVSNGGMWCSLELLECPALGGDPELLVMRPCLALAAFSS
mmetsp:Transcript_8160/g.11436  ORF Transcript_8160/g.11436 Transcript_8160/m.11436 type:complete len:84 (-) Transcript_8160:67-318(-)